MKSKQSVSHPRTKQPTAARLPLSPNELARIKDQETKKARIARLNTVRSAERDLARERRLKFDAARRGKEEETIRLMTTSTGTGDRQTCLRPTTQLVKAHYTDPTTNRVPLGSAHQVAKEINAQRTRQQVNRVHSQIRSEQAQVRRAKDALIDEMAHRATPTVDLALRTAEMDAAKRKANARSIAKARAHMPAPTLIPVDALPVLPFAIDLHGATSPSAQPPQQAHQLPGIPVVEYQSTRFHSTLLRDALPHSVDRSEPNLNTISSSTHALNQSQQLEASTAAKQHLTQDQARRAAARGEAALAQLRAQRVHDEVHAALETARARDWDRRKVQFADYLTDRTPATAPVPDQAKLEQAFANRFPDATRLMAQELGEILADEHHSVSRAFNRSQPPHSRSESRSRSRSRSTSPQMHHGQATLRGTRSPVGHVPRKELRRYPPFQPPPSTPSQRAPPVPLLSPQRSSLEKPERIQQHGTVPTELWRQPESSTRKPRTSPTRQPRPRSAPTPILPDPLAFIASTQTPSSIPQQLSSQAHVAPVAQGVTTEQKSVSTPNATDESELLLPLASSSVSDSLFAGISAPSTAPSASSFLRAHGAYIRKSGSNDSGTTWSTWGTATIDDMIDELGSWLSDAV